MGESAAAETVVARKRCTKCGDPKPLIDFHRYRKSRDGRYFRCKLCQSSAVLSSQKTPIGRLVMARSRIRPKLRAAQAKVARYEARLAELDAEYQRLKERMRASA